MDSEQILDAIDKQEWLESPATVVQKTVLTSFEAAGEPGTKAKDFLHGRWLGHALHPAITDVPVGAWTVAAVLDALSACADKKELDKGADAAIGIGLLGAVGAAVTGITDWSETEERPRKVGFVHAAFNITATGFFLASWLMRRSGDADKRGTARCLSWTGYAFAMCGAWLGGELVSTEKIGVDNAPRDNWPQDWMGVLPDKELPEGALKQAMAGENAIVLTRRNGEIFALAERCSHLGGPLSEGEFCDRDGELALRCPWHGSCFALRSGKVLEGPATHPQPVLEVRVIDGQIQVRHKADL